jgi:hypothetical protein
MLAYEIDVLWAPTWDITTNITCSLQEGSRMLNSIHFQSRTRGFHPSTQNRHDHPRGKEAPSGEDSNLLHPDREDHPEGLPPTKRDGVNSAPPHIGWLDKTVRIHRLWAPTWHSQPVVLWHPVYLIRMTKLITCLRDTKTWWNINLDLVSKFSNSVQCRPLS